MYDAEENTAETSTQCPENGEFRAQSQAEVDAFAENYPECEQLISLKIALPIYLATTPLIQWFLQPLFNGFMELPKLFNFAHIGDRY